MKSRFEIAQDTYNIGFKDTGNAMMLAALDLEDLPVRVTSSKDESSTPNYVGSAKAGNVSLRSFCHREDYDIA